MLCVVTAIQRQRHRRPARVPLATGNCPLVANGSFVVMNAQWGGSSTSERPSLPRLGRLGHGTDEGSFCAETQVPERGTADRHFPANGSNPHGTMRSSRAKHVPLWHSSPKGETSRMTRTRISQGSVFEEQIGYSRAVVDGRWVFVAGTTGYDYTTMTISDDVVQQARQTLANIDEALSRAGSCAADVVRVHYLLPDAADFEPCWPVLREYFAAALPAATMMVVGLASPAMKIEIEVTALKPDDD